MYCSSCGSAVPPNLTYCNKCGAKVARADTITKPSDLIPESLVFAMVAVFILGVGVTIGLMAVMKQAVGFDWPLILAVTMVCFMLIMALEAVIISLIFKSVRFARELVESGPARLKEQTTKEL